MAFSMIFCNPCDPFAKTQAKKNNTVAAHLSQIVALESHVFMIFLVACLSLWKSPYADFAIQTEVEVATEHLFNCHT